MFYSNCTKTLVRIQLGLSLSTIQCKGECKSSPPTFPCSRMLTSTYLRTGCASLLRGTGMPPAEGALGLGKPLLIAVVPVGLVSVVLLILLGGFAGTVL